MKTELTTLPSGLRIVTDSVPDMHTIALGIWCDVGTRYEDLSLNGIAHLVEHMLFKGTKTRSALEIAESIENVGGQMNAYTSREHTAYFIHLLKDDMRLGLEILCDMMRHSTFPEEELEKEREVILQEIGMITDTPDDLVFDLYQAAAYPEQALGAPILGTARIISTMPHSELAKYTQHFYTPERLVISAAGAVEHEKLVAQVTGLFKGIVQANDNTPAPKALYKGGETRLEKDLEQSHIVLGFQGVSRLSEKYETALLLSTILGGGMSSRLFQEVREKRGLVYSVYSTHSAYRDDGQFEIYAGTGPERLSDLIPVICEELCKIAAQCPSSEEIARAKAQVRANLLMSRESMLSRADRQARYLMTFGELPNIEAAIQRIDDVSQQDLCDLAIKIFTARPTLAALGPVKQLEGYEEICQRLKA